MRWKYVYYFLIVTFLVVIFISLISISVTMYLNERRNKPTTIYSFESASDTLASDTDENYNCISSVSDQGIDITKNVAADTSITDDNKNAPNPTIHSMDSTSPLLINNNDGIDDHFTSSTSQSTDTLKREPTIAPNSDIDDRSKKIVKPAERSTLAPDESVLWLDVDNPDWILPIFFRNVSESPSIWKYDCLGTLIHPKAVLSVRLCIQSIDDVVYAVGIFDHQKNNSEVKVNDHYLYNPANITEDRSYTFMNISYTENNERTHRLAPEYGLIVMIIDGIIDFIRPVDVSRTSLMPLCDILNDKIEKECIHITYVKDHSHTNRYVEHKVPEKFMNQTAIIKSYKSTLINFENLSIDFFPDVNFFDTVSSLNLTHPDQMYELFGGPLVCRLVGDEPNHFSFAGLLSNSFYQVMYKYTNIHYELEWIKNKLEENVA